MKILKTEIKIYWEWWRLFRKDWYTGNRLRFPSFRHKKKGYYVLFDFGALTIAIRKNR
jgi:hypothetical protein